MSEQTYKFSKHGKPVEAPAKGKYYVATVPTGTDKGAAQKELRKLHPGVFFMIRVEKEGGSQKADTTTTRNSRPSTQN